MSLIPVTIITGFLGAGKTTLLNRILRDKQHKQRIAVIENEFGEENIDSNILVQDDAEQIVEMSNGCICCTIRSDLVTALTRLANKRKSGEISFDRVVIETTGLADPGPVAQTFFLEDAVAEDFMIDGIITLMDAVFAMRQLDEYEQARQQVGYADRLLISKTDLVSAEDVELLINRLRRINPHASIHTVDFGRIPVAEVLDLRGFNLSSKLDVDADGHDHHHDHDHPHDHACSPDCGCSRHLDDIGSFVFHSKKPFDPDKLNDFFDRMITLFGPQMLRYKGVLYMKGADRKVVFQGVQQLMGTDVVEKWDENHPPESKLVFIGKNLPRTIIMEGLHDSLAD